METLKQLITAEINRELKSSLFYCLQAINPNKYLYTYEESFTKAQLRGLLIDEFIQGDTINVTQVKKLKTYRDIYTAYFDENKKIEFESVENLTLETSLSIIGKEDNVRMQISLQIESAFCIYFEMSDKATGGENWSAEGSILFEDMKINDYDGIFSLPESIVNKLNELGFNTDYLK